MTERRDGSPRIRRDTHEVSVKVSIQLEAHTGAPAQGRRWVATALARMGRDELSETAQLVASELIANAVVHGAGPITVSVAAADGTVALEVQDRGRAARLDTGAPMPGPDSAGGRGLPIVRALARTVEVDPGRDGGTTRVTAVLATPGGVQVER